MNTLKNEKSLSKMLQNHERLAVYKDNQFNSFITWDGEVYREDEWQIKWDMNFLFDIANGKVDGIELRQQ